MTDRVKETLFNILGHRLAAPGELPGVAVLDVFAGSGNLGIEALSRGATACTFIERDRTALRVLRENLAELGLNEVARVLADNAWSMRPPPRPGGHGLIFLDPPFKDAENALRVADLLERWAASLAPDGLIIFRHESHAKPPTAAQLRTLRIVDERLIGRTRLLLLSQEQGAAAS
jgi:16S rRNA (guanine966-N2)-methyltransferase